MANDPQDSTSLPLQENFVHDNKMARIIELVILSLLISMLVYRVVSLKDQSEHLPWLLAFLCESWFTFIWIIGLCIKWNQCSIKTYPDRLLKRANEFEFPKVDIFVTTADPILEPCIITMNTVLSLLAVDYPTNKFALYLSDDGCSPVTYYSLVETTKFAKLWVPFCKKYNIQVRAPFRYFTSKSTMLENDSLKFHDEWRNMKNEYDALYKKIEVAPAERPFTCESDPDFAVFCDVNRSNHPAIIKVISENNTDLPHVIYISREKNPKHHHHYKAGAMNVLTRVSGVMTNAPLMLNVDCDMYAHNPQVFLHAMCMVFDTKNDQECGFFQFPQAFYDGLKDDPFGNQLTNYYYLLNGVATLQGSFNFGTNCFHRRKVIYGLSPKDKMKTENVRTEDLHEVFGKSTELRESAAQMLSGLKLENGNSPSSLTEAAIHVAGCTYEYGTQWGKKVGWLYGSVTEDILTGLGIHGRGWRSAFCLPHPFGFLGCAPSTFPSSLAQQKRWANGMLEILLSDKNPLLLTIKGNLWFRQALAYYWIGLWGIRSIPELCYAFLPAYCIITGSHFLPNVNEWDFIIVAGIFVVYYVYVLWECKSVGVSLRMWWNIQRMARVTPMTAWLFAFLSVVLKLIGLSKTVFEVTQKEHNSNDDTDDKDVGRFTYDNSPMIVPAVVVLLVNMTALVSIVLRLLKVDYGEIWMEVLGLGLGEMFCSVWVLLCFSEFLKGLFRSGVYGIPSSTIWKSGVLGLLFVHLCKRSQSF